MEKQVLIIGSGAGGLVTASALRKQDSSIRITVLTESKHLACSPCSYPYLVSGELDSVDDVCKRSDGFYKKKNIEIVNTTVRKIMPKENRVISDKGDFTYDTLVIAIGSEPFRPPIRGIDSSSVFEVSTSAKQAEEIRKIAGKAKDIVVVGAGSVGLEFAESFSKLGKDVHVFELMDRVLPNILDRDMSSLVESRIKDKATLHLLCGVDEIKEDKVCAKDITVKSDMVLLSLGVRANVALAKDADIAIGPLGAIKVDKSMRTNFRNIYALGDCVESSSCIDGKLMLSQLGSTACRQAYVVAGNILGKEEVFDCALNPAVISVFGLYVGSTGFTEDFAKKKDMICSVRKIEIPNSTFDKRKRILKFILDSDGIIIGFQVISHENITDLVNFASFAIRRKTTFEQLSRSEFAYHPKLSVLKFLI